MELYQRIEQLIGKQLPLHPTVEEEVMALMERVTEAQRMARMVGVAWGGARGGLFLFFFQPRSKSFRLKQSFDKCRMS